MTLPSRAGFWPGSGEAGFTLLEMLVVLAVLGLLAGLVVARGPQRSPALELRAAAEGLAGSLRLARSRAIATNRPVTVTLDRAGTLRVGDAPARPLPGSVTVDDLSPGSGPVAIRFAPDGSASGGGVMLAAAGRRVAVAVDWLTGRVRVRADGDPR